MKIFAITYILFFSANLVFCQNVITGQVKDKTGNMFFGANVYIKGTYDGASTDPNGIFHFETFEIGKQFLVASFIGYKSKEFEVYINQNLSDIELILEEEINKIDGITISAGAFEAGDKKKSVMLRTFDIVTTAGATADIAGVMNTLPGTQTVGEEGRLFVRGGAGHETKTFINGLLVSDAFTQSPQNIPSRFRYSPFLFKGAFFSTGGYSVEYGQALSSVLLLDTYDLPARSQTDISVMSVGGDISQTTRKGNTSIYAQLQYTDLSAYFALVPQKNTWDKAPGSVNTTLHLKQELKKGGSFQAYFKYDRSRLKMNQPISGKIHENALHDISNSNSYTNFSLSKSIAKKASIRSGLSFGSSQNYFDIDNGLEINTHSKSMHLKGVIDHDLSEHVLLKYGYEWILNKFDEDVVREDGTDDQDFNFNNHMLSPFIEADVYLSNRFVARIGGRYEYNSLARTKYLSPRVSIAYKTGDCTQVSLAHGQFTQLPVPEYLKWNNKLQLEKSLHYILNYQYSNSGRIFRSEIFYKKYNKLITWQHDESHNLENTGYGYAKGFEIFWRDSKTFNSIDYWISYSFLDTKRKYDSFIEPVMPFYASNHNLSIVYKHFISKLRSQIGCTYSFSSGRPYTDPNTGKLNSKRTKNYHDISLNYSFLLKPNMIIHASASNIVGFDQVFGYQFNGEPNEQGIYESIPITTQAKQFLFLGFFITISKDKNANQLNNL